MQDHNIFGCKIYSESIFLGLNFILHTHTPVYKCSKYPLGFQKLCSHAKLGHLNKQLFSFTKMTKYQGVAVFHKCSSEKVVNKDFAIFLNCWKTDIVNNYLNKISNATLFILHVYHLM